MGDAAPNEPQASGALEGEIVLVGYEYTSERTQQDRARKGRQRILDDDTVTEIIRERLVKRRTLRDIASEYGISTQTVLRYANEFRHAAPPSPNVVKTRELLDDEFEVIATEGWKLYRMAKDSSNLKDALKALSQLESILRARALLHGANAPVRHDLTVAVVTDAERELQEMIAEAKAKESNREQAVIDAASQDETL